MKQLATHTLLAFALLAGILPADQCLNLIFARDGQCCESSQACACCKLSHGMPSDSENKLNDVERSCCEPVPGSALQIPTVFNAKTISSIDETLALSAFPAALLADTRSGMAMLPDAHRQHPPDTPLFLKIHALLV